MARYIIIDTEAEYDENHKSYRDENSNHLGRVLSPEETEAIWKEVYDHAHLHGYNGHDWDEFKETL